ncbi:DUF3298 and DUF4163 domain-containing protein [Treponema sp. OMZ 787]|uniref:DUF3298 and DUF4163 domain-containing protein n=1 Tax=Treponema sp. OMZ 787 TaxID=2563669 RepID=UPI0020A3C857|nr:DUF3298 and DUF4163 domain-containing protein [Treponema sp. OMZ 787]UTC62766.1 DUF3298 and DUF4163 domain-containing protein [Treponema sp. OMZ 787]
MKSKIMATFCLIFLLNFLGAAESSYDAVGGATESNSNTEIEQDAVHCEVKIDFPIFEDIPILNALTAQKAKEVTDEFWNGYYSISPDDMAKSPTARNFELVIGYDDIVRDKNYISFVLSIYEYAGGAHGLTSLVPVNYDIKTKKLVSLADVLRPASKNWLTKLSNEARKQLTNKVKKGELSSDEGMIKEGTEPKLENFDVFQIENGKIKIIFEQYQVAPYSEGLPEITIPIDFFR